jgi:plasmid stabilization system protein ParE
MKYLEDSKRKEMGKFSLRYLPLFIQDLTAARDYIAIKLESPAAAQRLIDETEKAIQKRLLSPLSHKAYPSKKERKYPYYRIRVKNYIIFYVVIDTIMEVRRFLYNKRNIDELV